MVCKRGREPRTIFNVTAPTLCKSRVVGSLRSWPLVELLRANHRNAGGRVTADFEQLDESFDLLNSYKVK